MFQNIIHFPTQRRSVNEKDEHWYKKCVDTAMTLVLSDIAESIRQHKYQMVSNYRLANDQLDTKDVEQVINYWGMEVSSFPAKMQNYPVAYNKVALLLGEEYKRRFDWRVGVINPDAVSEKEAMITKKIQEFIAEKITQPNLDEAQLQREIKQLDHWKRYEAQDIRERRASQLLKYHSTVGFFPLMFNRGYEDALVAAEEIYCTDIIAGEPIARKVNPLNLYTIRLGDNYKIDESDIIVEDGYLPIGEVIDRYYDYLSPDQISSIEEGKQTNQSLAGSKMVGNITWMEPILSPNMYSINGEPLMQTTADRYTQYLNGTYDFEGNVRVTRVVWKGMRKIGKLTYFDEFGEEQSDFVDENYIVRKDLGESIKWYWISEWYEGTKIASDIYIKMQPRPVQFRSLINPSKCGSGYVGTVYNINGNKALSLMDRMKPWQYFYDTMMYRIELAIAKYHGPIIEMDFAKMPDTWTQEQWMYYMQTMGVRFVDSFKENSKGAHQGAMAGGFNTTGSVLNPDMHNYIMHMINLLSYAEKQIGKVSGVNDQREGQIDNRETVGGVERAVVQSSTITEKYFMMHENTKVRFLNTFLETCKYAYRNAGKKKFAYIGDDMTSVTFDLDGDEFNDAEYGVFVSNSQSDAELLQAMKSLAQAGLQTDKLNFTQLMDIYRSEDLATTRRKIEQYEEERIMQQQQQQQQQLQVQQQEIQAKVQLEQQKLQNDVEKNIRDNNTKLEVAYINAEAKMNDQDIDNDGVPDQVELEKMTIDREKMVQDAQIEREKMNIKREEIQSKERIAKSKPAAKTK